MSEGAVPCPGVKVTPEQDEAPVVKILPVEPIAETPHLSDGHAKRLGQFFKVQDVRPREIRVL
ncbi:hypothetical protein BRL54_08865 [Corynebacterium ulcerans]|nr:hypothetical protein BRL54_08865 [Corynebacterium ulcerans]